MNADFQKTEKLIGSYHDQIVESMRGMICIRAVSPKSGGEGELKRAEFLQGLLKSWGIETRRYDYKDDSGVTRPNIIARLGVPGRTVWFVAHMDTVSEGDPKLWKSDPFKLKVDGGRMYGRGANDDGQGLMASIYAMKALKESGASMKYGFGIALVADEEMGNRYGMEKLVHEKGLFARGDMFVVPDWGSEKGDVMEIGEKGVLWLKVTVIGKQVHASTPGLGKNAYRHSIRFLNAVDDMLHSKYSEKDASFSPSASTFEMTKHEKNVDSVNIIPGTEVSYIDCRVLPRYRIDDVVADVKRLAESDQFKGTEIRIEEFNREDSGPVTSPDSEIAKMMESSIAELRGIRPKKIGVGGGTCAALARKAGMDAVVWSTQDNVAHQPNEYADIKNVIDDAKVFARMML